MVYRRTRSIIEQLVHAIIGEQSAALDPARQDAAQTSRTRYPAFSAAILDMDISVSVYIETLDGCRRRSAEAPDAAKAEVRAAAAAIASAWRRARRQGPDLSALRRSAPGLPRSASHFDDAIAEIEEAVQGVTCSAGAIRCRDKEVHSLRAIARSAPRASIEPGGDRRGARSRSPRRCGMPLRALRTPARWSPRRRRRGEAPPSFVRPSRRSDGIAESAPADRPHHRRDRRDRVPDQPARAERRGRGRPRRRQPAGFCRRRLRGAGAGAAFGRGGQGSRP